MLVITSFADRATAALYDGRVAAARRIPAVIRASAVRKLDLLEAATSLQDLRSPPGNRLEALSGDRSGCHSIRINQQWRIVFRWVQGEAHEVEIVDYHD